MKAAWRHLWVDGMMGQEIGVACFGSYSDEYDNQDPEGLIGPNVRTRGGSGSTLWVKGER